MLTKTFNFLSNLSNGDKIDDTEPKEFLLNWLAAQFKVQPSFVTPWMPLDFVAYTEENNIIEWVKENPFDAIQELSHIYGLPTYEQSQEVIKEVEGLPPVHPSIPEPTLIYTPTHSHWILFEYNKKHNHNDHILYVVENDEFAHKVSFLVNSILGKFAYNLYYPHLADDADVALENIKPSDYIWDFANLWKPSNRKIKQAQNRIS